MCKCFFSCRILMSIVFRKLNYLSVVQKWFLSHHQRAGLFIVESCAFLAPLRFRPRSRIHLANRIISRGGVEMVANFLSILSRVFLFYRRRLHATPQRSFIQCSDDREGSIRSPELILLFVLAFSYCFTSTIVSNLPPCFYFFFLFVTPSEATSSVMRQRTASVVYTVGYDSLVFPRTTAAGITRRINERRKSRESILLSLRRILSLDEEVSSRRSVSPTSNEPAESRRLFGLVFFSLVFLQNC